MSADGLPRLLGLKPHVAPDARLLVLGSFPGVASLQAQQYYGHPRNQLWRLLGDSLGLPLAAADYPRRLNLLLENRIGLWDVISETQRRGSLDSDIRDPRPSDLLALLARLPALRVIAFNGATAAKIGLRQLGPVADNYRILALPSSSPAYTLAYAGKLAAWGAIADELNDSSYE
ncbi:DNA-deoxyinosine glycosylase [Roseateles oligotrophus]|uniref:DNA-deoxyinosine glycosylase n=1 Tax=Roseateles oligotrophus TaxID=1769250 RepID=A0ABT2YA04_9BURK|nr:DNA-deoxyinosine glycosylase [Roseateles oligotrophus]MCV2367118.1 DNA-deoxyinosine glycosylase [Roseateles oligotrophus]